MPINSFFFLKVLLDVKSLSSCSFPPLCSLQHFIYYKKWTYGCVCAPGYWHELLVLPLGHSNCLLLMKNKIQWKQEKKTKESVPTFYLLPSSKHWRVGMTLRGTTGSTMVLWYIGFGIMQISKLSISTLQCKDLGLVLIGLNFF